MKVMLSSGCYRDALHAGHKAATLYAMSSDSFRSSKSARCGLHLSVGRFQRWLIDAGTAPYVQEGAAIYAAACIESILDDIVLCAFSRAHSGMWEKGHVGGGAVGGGGGEGGGVGGGEKGEE